MSTLSDALWIVRWPGQSAYELCPTLFELRGSFSLTLSCGFFPQAWLVSSHKHPDNTQLKPQDDSCVNLQNFLSVHLSPPWFCTLHTSSPWPIWILLYSWRLPSSIPTPRPENCLKAIIWGSHRTHLICFPSLRGHGPSIHDVHVLKLLFCIFCLWFCVFFSSCFRLEVNLVSVSPPWPEIEA